MLTKQNEDMILDKLKKGDKSVLQGISPLVAMSLSLQLQEAEKTSLVNYDEVGEAMKRNISQLYKPMEESK
ncbi:hypothetical protein COF68_14120 [Bacillus toyonensis]|uniref:hypothetical protein n=1 Tax=Bacillus cereus group TaxID=86661 RepID=UPI000B4AEA9E|nr:MULTISPECIES: hypothetical protein [Bacillus cereus group]PFW92694.1 hypothetical protein COL33_14250 [Bacillus toyonensis]PFY46748.1 hypothetical protein COL50_08110 [Bacillus toyonensis]PFY77925.1 hypothetical protein COL46_01550 [Bacillus toyonensis]PGE93953.1 hypothetical protein COM75_00820 [Bacillus toyonensis]PHA93278.1 hypothetical protein COE77_01605 [Bacillus toyonensis]